jgi:putative addiction module component (TIGR02574 family)
MSTRADNLVAEIRSLPEEEKLKVLDALLTDLDKRDPEIDRVWASEARRRWNAYQAGKVETVSYEELMAKYSRSALAHVLSFTPV